jgi:hypothetical protein
MECKIELESTPHDTWSFFRQAHRCTDPSHAMGLYIVIRRCHHCGTFTEWMQLDGPGGGIVELILDANEVAVVLAGLTNNEPDAPF